jgi:hypothetical protein
MVDVGKREDQMLDRLSAYRHQIDAAVATIEEALLARPHDPVLEQLWFLLK